MGKERIKDKLSWLQGLCSVSLRISQFTSFREPEKKKKVIIWSFLKYNFQYLQCQNKMCSICPGILYCSVSSFTGRHCWQIYYFVLEPADFCLLTEKNRTHDMLFYRCWWSRLSQGPVDPFHYIIQCSIFVSLRLQLKKEECEETGEEKNA